MPIVRPALLRGQTDQFLQNVSDAIHDALVEAYEMPPQDRFQIISQHEPNELLFDKHFRGGPRTEGFMMISILGGPRTDTVKQAFLTTLVAKLAERAGVRPGDVFVTLQSAALTDFSFGSGVSAAVDAVALAGAGSR